MKKLTIIAGSLALLASFSFVLAQTAGTAAANPMTLSVSRNGHVKMDGTLVSVSGSNLTVSSWGGNWIIDVSSAKVVRRFGGKSNVSEMKSGDAVTVMGTVSQSAAWAITASAVKDNSLEERYAVSGVISNPNSGNQSFTLTTAKGAAYTVTLESGAKVYVNGRAASFGDLANGMAASARGVVNTKQLTISADAVRARTSKPSVMPSTTPAASSTNH